MAELERILEANRILSVALLAALSAQVIKFLFYLGARRRARLDRLVGAGGMPSSHSAMVAALATAVGYDYGWTSALFAVSCIFGLVVLYDAIGVRRTVGLQSRYLNQVSRSRQEFDILDREFPEYVGHTPREVVAGAVWGILISLWLH